MQSIIRTNSFRLKNTSFLTIQVLSIVCLLCLGLKLYFMFLAEVLFSMLRVEVTNLWVFTLKQYVWHLQTADFVPVFRLFASRE